ncbi:hypothetical protein T08_12705 [Trichinella sp. T8]|nr:hypothetical protein T08_12705 [Trichinella sp. T8]
MKKQNCEAVVLELFSNIEQPPVGSAESNKSAENVKKSKRRYFQYRTNTSNGNRENNYSPTLFFFMHYIIVVIYLNSLNGCFKSFVNKFS